MKKNNDTENNKNSGMTRRSFIGKTSLAAAAITIVPRHVLGGQGHKAPSDTLNIVLCSIEKEASVLCRTPTRLSRRRGGETLSRWLYRRF